jgi:diaminohydroxyphosphoribosylaminopyrimidine deaminase/5-amino-6-(5-phosphoribosylamino)uracil reductase
MDTSDREHMAHALRLAENGLYTTDPNPSVGCVLVVDGGIVGEGWTAPAGGPHAERVALAQAGAQARGATAYVTLEPCSHTGRTGPCTAALIEAGVARVVCAMLDPNPLVAGSGGRLLQEAGIAVETGMLASEAEELNRGYLARMRRGRPWVRSKLAVSIDGRTALANGRSRWLTGPGAREDVHRWRARSSVVLTGIGTVLADDPALDARLEDAGAAVLQPARAILDPTLRTPPNAKTLSLPGNVLIFATEASDDRAAALAAAGARIERVSGTSRCNLGEVMRRLAGLEYNEIWVEAGPTLNGALLSEELVDELVVYFAPTVLGSDARGMFDLGELARLDDAPRFRFEDARLIGDDLRVICRPLVRREK